MHHFLPWMTASSAVMTAGQAFAAAAMGEGMPLRRIALASDSSEAPQRNDALKIPFLDQSPIVARRKRSQNSMPVLGFTARGMEHGKIFKA
jgi:hypothetical protein